MKKFFLVAFAILTALITTLGLVAQAAEPGFGNPQFRNVWQTQDRLVGTAGIERPYTWGPSVPAALNALSEQYNESPGGQRQVQYFDKARLELNNPQTGLVTTGLLVRDLVSGIRQDGENTYTRLQPSRTQVAGDPVSVNPNAPVYASFVKLVTLGQADENSRPPTVGQFITESVNQAGQVSTIQPPVQITFGAYEVATGHNIARPFQDFKFQRGPLTDPATGKQRDNQLIYTDNPTSNVFGFAISEPYWVVTRIGGVERTVLVQLFQRRVLTYNPALPSNNVEMGNVGQHYYQWRYLEGGAKPVTATPVGPGGTVPPPGYPTPPTTALPFGLDSEEYAFYNQLNQYRKDKGLAELSLNSNLIDAARWMSQDMAAKNYFDHSDSLGRDSFKRMAAFGYFGDPRGENIAAGYETARLVMAGWQSSAGHNANMLKTDFKTIGISRAYDARSSYKWYWTTDFGGQ